MRRPNDRRRVDLADSGGCERSPVDERCSRSFGRRARRGRAAVSWRLLVVAALLAASVAMVPVGPAAAQADGQGSQQSQATPTDGKELLLPQCVPDAARAATAEAGAIKFVLCPDHLQIESVATASDITFYPSFSPDRHSYVVHVADSVSEVRFEAIYRTLFPWGEGYVRPGFGYGIVDSAGAYLPHCPRCTYTSANNNADSAIKPVHVRLTPGVTTVEIGANLWFKRTGSSQAESDAGDWAWLRKSDKLARTRYTLQLVWKSPDTPLVAPDELTPIGTVDYDTDDDGLIEVSSLAQLDAVRWDANGDGYSDHGGPLHKGFPNALAQMGCPSSGCVGYELAGDLDFDTNASGDADSGDDYWNSGHGWVPIGADTDHFSGVFEGNGHTISGLFINSDDVTQSTATGYRRVNGRGSYAESRSIHLGLFEELARGGVIRNIGLADASVTRTFPCLHSVDTTVSDLCDKGRVGGLVGVSAGTIRGSWVTGKVSNNITLGLGTSNTAPAVVGGLVGQAHSSSVIATSFASADVSASVDPPTSAPGTRVGGLVGINAGAITAAYATGTARSSGDAPRPLSLGPSEVVGGLVAHNSGSITASYVSGSVSGGSNHPLVRTAVRSSRVYHSYWDSDLEYGWRADAGGVGKTTAELQAPTDYTGIYANWNVDIDGDGSADDPWSFGTSSEYPTLTGVDPGSNQQVGAGAGDQLQEQADPGVPDVPGPVTALELSASSNSVTVSWQPPEIGEAPTRYIVHLRPEGGGTGSGKTKNPKAKKTQVTFKKLKPGVTYNVWVRAQNQSGKGERVHATITLPEE